LRDSPNDGRSWKKKKDGDGHRGVKKEEVRNEEMEEDKAPLEIMHVNIE
jgi:hypothetical protein